jgi:hypothetical protein
MRRIRFFFEKGTVGGIALAASALVGLIAAASLLAVPIVTKPVASMLLEPREGVVAVGGTFEVQIVVASTIPVNVFSGTLTFDPLVLAIEKIDYNISIADLWAKKPWYSNGDGTLTFIGGTTRPGGFIGREQLITVTFKSTATGTGLLALYDSRILQHDGLGTDALLEQPIDALFTVEDTTKITSALDTKDGSQADYRVVDELPSTDLNHDGKQGIGDVSIFILNVGSGDPRFDFNQDGSVDTKDLSIIMRKP